MTRDYPTLADVIAIHDNQIETYGGLQGLRDPGQLDAALFRPQSGYYTDVIAEAAAVWESLSQNHPFVDGNKWTSFASMFTFLAINQVELTASADETYRFVHDLYETGGFQFEALESWLRENTRNLSTRP